VGSTAADRPADQRLVLAQARHRRELEAPGEPAELVPVVVLAQEPLAAPAELLVAVPAPAAASDPVPAMGRPAELVV
jgi:hypothetical protein